MRCKLCVNPQVIGDRPIHLPAGLTEYILKCYASESPPFHVTTDNIEHDGRTRRAELDTIKKHRFVRDGGRKIAVM